MVVVLFHGDDREVLGTPGSQFYNDICEEWDDADGPCPGIGTIEDFIRVFFGGKFDRSHLWYDILALALYLISARALTFFALKHFNYSDN